MGNQRVSAAIVSCTVVCIAWPGCGRSDILGEPDALVDDGVRDASDVAVETDAPRDTHDERDAVSQPLGTFSTVWGSSASDVYVFGEFMSYGGGAVRFDGTSWELIGEDHVDPRANFWEAILYDSGGSSSRDVLVVGTAWTEPMLPPPPNEHAWRFDGDLWHLDLLIDPIDYEDPLHIVEALRGVWSVSPSSTWVVGWGWGEEGNTGIVLHLDGTHWSLRENGRFPFLESIWGSSDDEMFAVGWEGTIIRLVDGAWQAMESPVDDDLNGIWGRSASDVFAVGDAGTIIHFDGEVWTVVDDDETIWPLHSVWGTPDGPVHAVGMNGAIVTLQGDTWEVVDSGTHADLNDVWGSAADDVYVVGAHHEDPMPFSVGVIVHFDGESWRPVEDLPVLTWP